MRKPQKIMEIIKSERKISIINLIRAIKDQTSRMMSPQGSRMEKRIHNQPKCQSFFLNKNVFDFSVISDLIITALKFPE
jgi:hypothetical protein